MYQALESLQCRDLEQDRCVGELANRVFLILDPGASEPDRVHADEPRSIEDPAGSHHTERLRAIRGLLHAATA